MQQMKLWEVKKSMTMKTICNILTWRIEKSMGHNSPTATHLVCAVETALYRHLLNSAALDGLVKMVNQINP